jgi:hypothetical protein
LALQADVAPIEGAEFAALVADIRQHGMRETVVLHEGRILDDRGHWQAEVRRKPMSKRKPLKIMEELPAEVRDRVEKIRDDGYNLYATLEPEMSAAKQQEFDRDRAGT